MNSDRSYSLTLSRPLAVLLIAAFVPAAAAIALWGWSALAPEASAAQVAPITAAPLVPMQAGTPGGDPCPQPQAAFDAFLEIDGIEGESTAAGHPGALEIESFSWGATQTGAHGAGGGGGAGKVTLQDFHFVAKVTKASPSLFLHCATGQHIKEAKLTVRKAGGGQQEYYVVKMTDILVTSFQSGGSSSDSLPLEEISFSYGKIEYSVSPIMPDGSLGAPNTATYDVKTNKGR